MVRELRIVYDGARNSSPPTISKWWSGHPVCHEKMKRLYRRDEKEVFRGIGWCCGICGAVVYDETEEPPKTVQDFIARRAGQ